MTSLKLPNQHSYYFRQLTIFKKMYVCSSGFIYGFISTPSWIAKSLFLELNQGKMKSIITASTRAPFQVKLYGKALIYTLAILVS